MQIRIVGTANMKQVTSEFAALQAQVAALNAQMLQSTKIPGGVNPKGYQNLASAINQGSQAYRNSLASTGRFHVEQLRINSATETYTELLQKQKLSIRDLVKNQRIMKAAYKEQLAIQNMVVRKTPSGIGDGRHTYDIAVPTMVSKEMDTINKRMGWYRAQLASAATQTVNWGKNTQWAGRQLMVGFTMPVAAFGAATGVMAYQVDKEMTRVEKVYDTAANGVTGSVSEMAAAERELAQLRRDSFNLAANAANSYGAAIQDTLAIEAELAATGLRGSELMKQTNEVMRVATLGEMEYTTALNASITAQSVFKMGAEETADAFNYMNAVENATSLQLADFAEALPIAAAPVQAFGGDIRELGVLLTAMKQNGIAATQGANAIKASMQRLLRPSAQVREEFARLTGRDITELVERGESLTDIFKLIGEATENLNDKQEGKVFAGLFGTYQVTRMRAMVEGMRDLSNETGQVFEASKLAEASTMELAEAANNELNRWQRSASGRFKRAVELFKVQMAEMGQPFLEVGASVVEFITKAAEAFNGLPKMMKNGLAMGAIFMAIVGPLVMLTGLFANFAGNIGKFASVIMGLVGRMNIMNKGQQAAALSAKLAESGLLSEASAVELLTQEIKLLSLAQADAAKTQQAYLMHLQGRSEAEVAAAMRAGTGLRSANVLPDSPSQAAGYTQGGKRAASPLGDAVRAAGAAKEQSRWMKVSAVSAGVFSAAMLASMVASNGIVDNIAKYAMIASGLVPVIGAITSIDFIGIKDSIIKAILPAIARVRTATGLWISQLILTRGIIGKMGMLFGGIGKALKAALLNPLVLAAAAIAAAGYGMYKLWQNSKKAADEVHRTYGDAEGLAEIYGFVASDMKQVVDAEGNLVESTADRVNKFEEAYGGLVDRIKEARGEHNKLNIAKTAGLNVINAGGTADQARLATFDALAAAQGIADAEKITIKFESELDFSNAETVANAGIQKALASVDEAVSVWNDRSRWESVGNYLTEGLFSGDMIGKVSNAAVAAANESGKAFAQAFAQASAIDNQELMDETLGIIQEKIENFNRQIEQADKAGDGNRKKALTALRDELTRTFASNMGVENAEELVEQLGKAVHVTDLLGMYFTSLTNQQRVMLLENKKNLDLGDRLALFGSRMGIGIEKATGKMEEMGGELTDLDRKAMRAEARMKGLIDSFKEIDFKGALRDAYSNTQDDIAGMMMDDFSARMEASLDATRAEADRKIKRNDRLEERENERFKNRWERRTQAVQDHFDARDKALQDVIDREKRLEELRQKMFDAEMKRISRLNEAANRNIDFNVALNTGNLDEAAKIRNDATAAATEWALGDAGDAARSKAERKIERLEGRKDKVKEAKDDRLQALKDREEAERKHLTKIQKMRADQLKRETENDIKAQEKMWNSRRKNMDEAIRYFKSYVATNEADLQRHINRTGKKYEQFGVSMKKEANGWSKVIGERLYVHVDEARNRMQSDIKWENMGKKTANKMLSGALGMTWKQFRQWMTSGEWPKDVGKRGINPKTGRPWGASEGHIARHTGGWINDGAGSRKGYARNAPLHRNEKMVLAEKGEFMVNKHAAAQHAPLLSAINSGKLPRNEKPHGGKGSGGRGSGGPGPGIAGVMGAIMSRVMKSTIENSIVTQAERKISEQAATSYLPGKAGAYGNENINFSASQMGLAAVIANVGSSMGMSKRDIQIGIMTAIAESMLSLPTQAQSDRDSGGLFQQRPSQGWGTVEQVMNPEYASRKFFEALKRISDRGGMTPWQAAQAVQRSAFSDGSNYRKYWDEAQDIYSSLKAGNEYGVGTGGWHAPIKNGRRFHNGHDISTPIGTPVYAVNDGRIVRSTYITSGGSPGHANSFPKIAPNGLPYRSYGEMLTLRTGAGDFNYAHLHPGSRLPVGRKVKGGAQLALSGNTGNSSGPHLHLDVNGKHIAQSLLAARGISLKKGAQNIRFDNTLANLHKGEAVLTEDINKKFRQGVDNFANGGNSTYNVNVNVEGTNASADEIANKVMTALKRQEGRKPRPRRGS